MICGWCGEYVSEKNAKWVVDTQEQNHPLHPDCYKMFKDEIAQNV